MKYVPIFLLIFFQFSCTSLPEGEEVIPDKQTQYEYLGGQTTFDFQAAPADKLNTNKLNRGCNCTFTTEVSSNLVGEEWFVDFSFEASGVIENIHLDGAAMPNLPNPFVVNRQNVSKGQIIPSELKMLYDAPFNALRKPGWIKFTLACQQAPAFTHFLTVPTFEPSGSVFSEKNTQITKGCGTVEIDDE